MVPLDYQARKLADLLEEVHDECAELMGQDHEFTYQLLLAFTRAFALSIDATEAAEIGGD